MADNAKWYVAHTYSGYENTVAASIEKAVENRGLRDLIHEVNIPLETVTEITDNGPKTVERKVFPGYVLVKMVMTDETWHLVRNVRGVTGFVGSGNKAIPLTDEEIASLGVEKREVVVNYQVGDSVKITDGALESFLGTVEEIDLARSKVRVVVSMFGREFLFLGRKRNQKELPWRFGTWRSRQAARPATAGLRFWKILWRPELGLASGRDRLGRFRFQPHFS